METPEINPYFYGQLIFYKYAKANDGGKEYPLQQIVLVQLDTQMHKNKDLTLHYVQKLKMYQRCIEKLKL